MDSSLRSSLFSVVDADAVEKEVLREAEVRARNSSRLPFTPPPIPPPIGFGPSILHVFSPYPSPLVLRIVAGKARNESRTLRGNGVVNLAAMDKVRMKQQILNALLRQRSGSDSDDEAGYGGSSIEDKDNEDSITASQGGDQEHRDELIRTGAITPLDSPPVSQRQRGRMTLMEHKIAEGMTVKLPHSHRSKGDTTRSAEKGRSDPVQDHLLQAEREDLQKSMQDYSILTENNPPEPSMRGTETMQQSLTMGSKETSSPEGWECPKCTLVGPYDALRCVACGQRKPRNRKYQTRMGMDEIVVCPLCKHVLGTGSSAKPDILISKHIDTCEKRKDGQEGQECILSRGSTDDYSGSETDEKSENPSGRRTNSAAGKKKQKKRSAKDQKVLSQSNQAKKAMLSHASHAPEVLKITRGNKAFRGLVDDYDMVDYNARKKEYSQDKLPLPNSEEYSKGMMDTGDFGGGLKMEEETVSRLFRFQITGVRWMWQLHQQGAGGIVGDEMGLGKTVQVSAYLGALSSSGLLESALIVAPATVLSHWMAELHSWAPELRVVILHRCSPAFSAACTSTGKVRTMVRKVLSFHGVVLITSYNGLKSLKTMLVPHNWDYCVLDEGQVIRNPDAEVTLVCKQIRTVHRLVLTGTPIQNNLRELWSLFDFVFPGRLGSLPAFDAEFATPIRVGGYASASPIQARLAYCCALVLRDLVQPYLLRRQKKDLQDILDLPKKTEQVLFCRLTPYQRRLYMEFLESAEVKSVLRRATRSFRAICILRKLCNHPDLVCRLGDSVVTRLSGHNIWEDENESDEDNSDSKRVNGIDWEEEGALQRSGKLLVLHHILPLWHKQGHRVLLFSQTRQMLNIIEQFVVRSGWSYGRLDGNTPVGSRQALIDCFNGDRSVFIMLLTTRTGGVGVNLTGADRVILFDPDWNPSTDSQARERAWRVGQQRNVTVYRLITAGTIEEKVYHRQIFKTALTNRVLQDPKQRRMFSADELKDLFTLTDDGALNGFTDTIDIFQGEGKVDRPDNVHDIKDSGRKRNRHHSTSTARSQCPETHGIKGKGKSKWESANTLISSSFITEGVISRNAGSISNEDNTIDRSKGDDSAVLQALFDDSPLSSVFLHDLAEDSSKGIAHLSLEDRRVEEDAKRAAKKALDQLRMSRQTVRAGAGQGGFQSSWTGRNGGSSAGSLSRVKGTHQERRFGKVSHPLSSRKNGKSSSSKPSLGDSAGTSEDTGPGGLTSQDLLKHIRNRNKERTQQAPGLFPELEVGGTVEDETDDVRLVSLLQRLQAFLSQSSQGIDTAAVVHEFSDVDPTDAPVFRQLLHGVAVCVDGEWTLREETSSTITERG
ncbi:unnamed protein product [Choristocarpus tenellus]